MSAILTKFDKYLASDGPAALVIREHLIPVEGADGIFFPATYAAKKQGESGGYNIDYENEHDHSGRNVALVDSVGSQANRIEPMFAEGEYSKLVPQIIIRAGTKRINLLDAGHRAGDAIARCSGLGEELHAAFTAVNRGNALNIAKLAPTSLVFGVWDSRDTQAKLPRLITSTVRAYNVRKLTRSAQYIPAIDYVKEGLLDEPASKEESNYSERGYIHVPATGTHGGVIADKGIRRDAALALSALKLLKADNVDNTQKLQRYILGLALVAFTKLPLGYYRQGTILVLDPDSQREFSEVALNGLRTPASVTHDEALEFAKVAAADFGVAENKEVDFEPAKAKQDVKGKEENKGGKKGKAGKKDSQSSDAEQSNEETE